MKNEKISLYSLYYSYYLHYWYFSIHSIFLNSLHFGHMVRNAEMAKCSDELIAFWDGESRGTRHMINFARKRGLEVSVINTTLKNRIDNNSQKTERNTIVAPDEEKIAIKCCH